MENLVVEVSEALGGVPEGVVYALFALAAVQIVIQVWALVDLVRRDRVMYDRKWIWAVVILVLSNFAIGAILYFAIGRRVHEPAIEPEKPRESNGDRTARAVDALYGSKEER